MKDQENISWIGYAVFLMCIAQIPAEVTLSFEMSKYYSLFFLFHIQ